MSHGIPPDVLVAAFRRDWPREAELTELRIANAALRDALVERREAETGPDVPPHVAEALAEFD